MKTTLLLGAGASVDAGLPDTVQLATRVVGEFERLEQRRHERAQRGLGSPEEEDVRERASRQEPGAAEALKRYMEDHPRPPVAARPVPDAARFVLGRLKAAAAERDPTSESAPRVDLEQVVTVLDALRRRKLLGVEGFVHDWDPELVRLDHPSLGWLRSTPVQYDHGFVQFVEQIVENRMTLGSGQAFGRAIERIRREVPVQLEITDSSACDYLTPIAHVATAAAPLTVATLNFDVAVETAADAAGVTWSDGIEGWSASMQLSWGGAALKLLKLHGSVSWADRLHRNESGLLLGTNKLTGAGPYVDLLSEFRRDLVDTERLVVIGYSFRDDHVNDILARWVLHRDLQVGRLPTIDIVDPALVDGRPLAVERTLARLIPSDLSRLNELDAIRIHPVKAAEFLASGALEQAS